MIRKEFAEQFAAEWVKSWNAHDLNRILSHYSDDFEMSSPLIAKITGEASGRLKGKEAVRAYWASALERMPDLRFKLVTVLFGADTVALYYEGPRGQSVEVFHFNADRKVDRAQAHYTVEV